APSGRGLSRRDWGRMRYVKSGSPPQANDYKSNVHYSRMPSAEIQIVRTAFSLSHDEDVPSSVTAPSRREPLR
ncbi:MAG: hypothetical protein IJP32_11055, partial [Clostridia bacterium]|nr:hypothetical protein [Clostridia bacterium]